MNQSQRHLIGPQQETHREHDILDEAFAIFRRGGRWVFLILPRGQRRVLFHPLSLFL